MIEIEFFYNGAIKMKSINKLIDAISCVLVDEKAYDLPSVCVRYGLENGEESEAFSSKRVYVQRRLKNKDQLFLIDLAQRIIQDYDLHTSTLAKILHKTAPTGFYSISEITRRNIMDELYSRGDISGKSELLDFLNRIWILEDIPSTDSRFQNASGDIWQHMINNSDWDEPYLFEEYLGLLTATDEIFIRFLEQTVHPIVRHESKQMEYIAFVDSHLIKDGYQFSPTDNISGYPIYKINKLQKGVKGTAKNLIFAAVGCKPEIVISDSINNDIKIVKHEENCLVYDRPIPSIGLYWDDLLKWWTDSKEENEIGAENEAFLYKRLLSSLDSDPEKILFDSYFRFFKRRFNQDLPALIPQVYLHYDPYTVKQRFHATFLPRQRMDFLLLLPNNQRIVLEIDGKHHYSDGDISSPRKYSEMVCADRELKLNGYEVYRFGGFEFTNREKSRQMIKEFFEGLFSKHGVKPN
ncbi:hypothetical protein IEK_01262 [Bacillus toyonensis]|nr:hypothetical protein [Bacillus luti]EJV52613.1 hypothetical protein IEK_01262 [Bacillus toyonensis]